jgi:hypothetical protein
MITANEVLEVFETFSYEQRELLIRVVFYSKNKGLGF